ncbi:site-specific integrase [Saccharothrix violaceirubra]|uniref:Integrase n=1 Tax=Saccharothrix violaceirubra TaxID=413306 RepID=A0A7W7WU53_9PSEU|nr:site-specific integrase [Saccharothrix violaceirubra]MBB4963859.1 integrase [Saccharothrix violaceirubra]
MPRPPLRIGTYGEINTTRLTPGDVTPAKWRADCRYRDYAGKVGRLERRATTEAKAKAALKAALAEILNEDLPAGADTKFRAVAAVWLDRIRTEHVGTTYDRYKGRLEGHVLPAIGDLYLRECTPGRLGRVLSAMKANGLSAPTRRGVRTVLSGVLQEAVDRGLLGRNPVRDMGQIKDDGRKKAVAAYDDKQLVDFLARLDGDRYSARADLRDLIRLLFGTGARFGEALALQWGDVNLGSDAIRMRDSEEEVVVPAGGVWFHANLVSVTGKGVVRHEGKTATSRGVVVMPEFLVDLLRARKPDQVFPGTAIFPSALGGWRTPSNVQRAVRRMRIRIGYPRFTTHLGRKTVATALDRGGHSAREIAGILRHANPSMTQNIYMAKGEPNRRAAATIHRLHSA